MFTNLTTQLARERQRQMLAQASDQKRHQCGYPELKTLGSTQVIGCLAGAAAKLGKLAAAWPARPRPAR